MARHYPQWKVLAMKDALDQIIDIEDDGHTVERFTDYHWRINGMNVWPSSKKYEKHGVIREYQNLKDIIK